MRLNFKFEAQNKNILGIRLCWFKKSIRTLSFRELGTSKLEAKIFNELFEDFKNSSMKSADSTKDLSLRFFF